MDDWPLGEPLKISTNRLPEAPPQPPVPAEGGTSDPAAEPRVILPQTPWQPDTLTPHAIVGHYDCWPAVVTHTYEAAADSDLNQRQAITARRVRLRWNQSDHSQITDRVPPLGSQPNQHIVKALPCPCPPDHPLYHVQAGDIVTIMEGRDGRHYYLTDDEPFIGTTIKWEGRYDGQFSSGDERFNDGTGNWTIAVQRHMLVTDPTADHFNWGGDRSGEGGDDPDAPITEATPFGVLELTYDRVWPVREADVHHGYRIDNEVLVWRKGLYYVCLPARETIVCEIVTEGPNGEAELEQPYYWVKSMAFDVLYAEETVGDETYANKWTGTSGDTTGFWVCAKNIEEQPNDEKAAGEVLVHMYQDPNSHEPYYLFERRQLGRWWTPGEGVPEGFCEASLPEYGNDISGETGEGSTDFYAKGFMYQDESGDLNPWIPLGFCQHPTIDPLGVTNGKAAPAGANLTDADGADGYVVGYMYRDAAGKLNPWFGISLSSAIANRIVNILTVTKVGDIFCLDGSYDPKSPPEQGKATPGGPEITGTPCSVDGDVWCTGHIYKDADGKLNPWISLAFCMDTTYSPATTPFGDLAAPVATNITGDPATAGHFYVKGQMYAEKRNGTWELNPWAVIDLSSVFCTGDDPSETSTDATGDNGDPHVDGVMYQDEEDQWNPRVFIDPTKLGITGDDSFWARITGSAAVDNGDQYTYTFVEVEKTVAGYAAYKNPRDDGSGNWTEKDGGQSGTAYNGLENVGWVHRSGAWCPLAFEGQVVRMRPVPCGANTEYWFCAATEEDS